MSPNCDCHAENDIPIIPNIGMLASFDPVALDQACADLCNKMPAMSGSVLEENEKKLSAEVHEHCGHDHFKMTHPDTGSPVWIMQRRWGLVREPMNWCRCKGAKR